MNSTTDRPAHFRQRALDALLLTDPATKAATTRALHAETLAATDRQAADRWDAAWTTDEPPGLPGRPARPPLVTAVKVPRRSPFTTDGRAALLHSIAHIEFNAINLALDAVWRFAGMPLDYYTDWLKVAAEEALHFTLLREHLRTLGHDYGDFDAHDGLWQMTQRTSGDIVGRMALVPRTLEARGLDATPPLQDKLRRAGDLEAVAILDIILRDEIGHVAIGNHWYRWLCERDGIDAESHYPVLVAKYQAPRLRAPFNLGARREAGFSEAELAALDANVLVPAPQPMG
jgi:uncharacterized ferritin-like protein (DUF455 family)